MEVWEPNCLWAGSQKPDPSATAKIKSLVFGLKHTHMKAAPDWNEVFSTAKSDVKSKLLSV